MPGLHEELGRIAADALACGPRLDVDSWDDPEGRADPFGFDLFVFPSRVIPVWRETRFCLGQGFWDHWLPLQAIIAGVATVKLLPPIIRHVRHAISRDENFFLFADEFATLMTGYMAPPQTAQPHQFGFGFPDRRYMELRAEAMLGAMPSVEAFARYIDDLSRHVVRYIDRSSTTVTLAAP